MEEVCIVAFVRNPTKSLFFIKADYLKISQIE